MPPIITTPTTSDGWSPDLVALDPTVYLPDALPLVVGNNVGRVEGDDPVVRVLYVDDDEAAVVPEGTEIAESDPDFNEVLVRTVKVAQLVTMSNEQFAHLQDGPRSPEHLSASMRRAVTKKANDVFVNSPAPTSDGQPPAGLLSITGVVDGGDVADNLDAIADAVTAIEEAGGAPTDIIAAPSAWGALRKMKDSTDSNAGLLGAGTADATRQVLGLPVRTTSAMPAGELLVVDGSTIVVAAGDLKIARSEHSAFSRDAIQARATWRFGVNAVRPDRLVRLAVAGATDGS